MVSKYESVNIIPFLTTVNFHSSVQLSRKKLNTNRRRKGKDKVKWITGKREDKD